MTFVSRVRYREYKFFPEKRASYHIVSSSEVRFIEFLQIGDSISQFAQPGKLNWHFICYPQMIG
ncbi:hypothetical protein BC643_2254 [Mangrovibacterium diazotrophicum]|uniref:Uncharacterized protein n=1 Tax=Mangrovibacterium diazotrophicum TaxID=1261403 RepID=A0A419W8V0_9BACT|nr:hypothetical protein BC643_2254 [Mangrovibacterium diazotrophicum]